MHTSVIVTDTITPPTPIVHISVRTTSSGTQLLGRLIVGVFSHR